MHGSNGGVIRAFIRILGVFGVIRTIELGLYRLYHHDRIIDHCTDH